eukprot:364741-Chlamydomonas_euryale.AAC.2
MSDVWTVHESLDRAYRHPQRPIGRCDASIIAPVACASPGRQASGRECCAAADNSTPRRTRVRDGRVGAALPSFAAAAGDAMAAQITRPAAMPAATFRVASYRTMGGGSRARLVAMCKSEWRTRAGRKQ